MDHQAAVDDHRPGGVTNDVVAIAELQFRLLAAELRRLWRGAMWALAAWLAAAALCVVVVPVALAGVGLGVAEVLGQGPAAGLLWVSLVTILLALALAIAGWRQIRSQAGSFDRSRNELRENFRLVKQAVQQLKNPFNPDA